MAAAGAPAWMNRLGMTAMLLGILFVAGEANEWMRQHVLDTAAPAGATLPAAACREDELAEEGLTLAECAQMVEQVAGYLVSRPDWFAAVQSLLAALGSLLGTLSIVAGAMLVNLRHAGTRLGFAVLAALVTIDVAHFVAAQQAGPIIRAIHLPGTLTWLMLHLALAAAFLVAQREKRPTLAARQAPAGYSRVAVLSHWFIAAAVFFLFVSSWWMLALPLPSADFRFREFPFQLHKNLGLTIALLIVVMATARVTGRSHSPSDAAETPFLRHLSAFGHAALYALLVAVCVTGYLSSSYSGWGTTWWWLIDLPDWGVENDALNQRYSDLHQWSCWALLIAMTGHIGAALLHALGNDGRLRRIVRW